MGIAMSKLYLQNIVGGISFDSLPAKWQGFDLSRFSKDKTLFDFQKQGLQNALKGLWLYFKDKKTDKQSLFNHYQANDFTENFDYDLKKREGKKPPLDASSRKRRKINRGLQKR